MQNILKYNLYTNVSLKYVLNVMESEQDAKEGKDFIRNEKVPKRTLG